MSLQNKGPEGRDAARQELADERGDLKGAPSPRIQQSDDQDLRVRNCQIQRQQCLVPREDQE